MKAKVSNRQFDIFKCWKHYFVMLSEEVLFYNAFKEDIFRII